MIDQLAFWKFLQAADPSLIVLTVMGTLVVSVVWSWHSDKRNHFHLQQVIVDSVTGRISIEKVGFMTVLAMSTWGFAALVIKGQLTEWYAALYVSVFVLGRFGNSWLSVKKDMANAPSNPPA